MKRNHHTNRPRAASAPARRRRFGASRRQLSTAAPRRGVILLMVLALLSLFLLIGMTLVMISSQARRSARAAARGERRLAVAPEVILDAAMQQLISGTNNRSSVLRTHSLLEDMYGSDGIPGTISTAFTGDIYAGNGYLGEYSKDIFSLLSADNRPLGEFLCLTFNEFGADCAPGIANTDDDGNSTTDGVLTPQQPGGPSAPTYNFYEPDLREAGWPGSDDSIVGLDGRPGVAGEDDDGDGTIDDGGFYNGLPTGGEVLAPGSDDCRLVMVNNYYAGRVITMTSGIAAGQSSRIVASFVRTPPHVPAVPARPSLITLVVRRFAGVPAPTTPGVQAGLQPGDTFIINGAPFNGTGFGLSLAQLQNFDDTGVAGTPFVLGAYEYRAIPAVTDPPQSVDVFNNGTWPFALLPNPAAFRPSRVMLGVPGTFPSPYLDPAGPGGADEDYDAVDYQNMLLAMRRTLPGAPTYAPPVVEIPSLHRPDLVRYWFERIRADLNVNWVNYGYSAKPNAAEIMRYIVRTETSSASNPGKARMLALKHQFLLRPLLEDHPGFAINNPMLAPLPSGAAYPNNGNGLNSTNFIRDSWEVSGVGIGGVGITTTQPPLWDVDNDGDGIADSIWVDIGLPVQQTPEGRLYKPLAAILCVDMDSRLNLNAHGNTNQFPLYNPPTLLYAPFATAAGAALPLPGVNMRMPVFSGAGGQGYGPAEVPLGGVLSFYGQDGFAGQYNAAVLSDDRFHFGIDGRPGRAYVDDDGDGIVDDGGIYDGTPVGGEFLAPGSDDGFVEGADGQPGIAGYDDNGNGLIDDIGELGWLGSDDRFEAARLNYGWINYFNHQQRIDGRYGEIWRNQPPLIGPNSIPPSPGVPNLMQPTSIVVGMIPTIVERPWDDREATDLLRYPDMPYFFKLDAWTSGANPSMANPLGAVNFPGMDSGFSADDDNDGRSNFVFDVTTMAGRFYAPDFGESGWRGSNDAPWVGTTYGTPPDFDGDGFVMLDLRGLPMYLGATSNNGVGEAAERWDDPYELDLSRNAQRAGLRDPNGTLYSRDNPFLPGDLEPLLRANDLDIGSLPSRLPYLAPTLAAHPRLRNLVTTDSWDLPGPSVVALPDAQIYATDLHVYSFNNANPIQYARPGAMHIAELLRNRILRDHQLDLPIRQLNTFSNTLDGVTLDYLTNQLGQHLGYDLMANLKLDINAPFGNGRDSLNSPNNVIDEFSEALEIADDFDNDSSGAKNDINYLSPAPIEGEGEIAWADASRLQGLPGAAMDLNRDGVIGPGDVFARQEMAKKLYLLLMLLAPRDFEVNMNATNTPADNAVEKARWMAQWAVNIVDYRDADSIMTPFEYDIFPFVDQMALTAPLALPNTPNPAATGATIDGDPWDVDGYVGMTPGPDRVWGTPDDVASVDDAGGAMYPYRGLVWGCERPALLITETLAYHDRRIEDDATVGGGKVGSGDMGNNFDQLDLPKGVLAFELFNPWNTDNAQAQFGSVSTPPAELSNISPITGEYGIQLDRRAGGSTAAGASPVWRLVVAPYDANMSMLDDPVLNTTVGATYRYIYFVEPTVDYGDRTANSVRYFAGTNNGSTTDENARPLVLPPRRYAVVVPANQSGGTELRQELNVGQFNGAEFARVMTLNPGNPVPSPVAFTDAGGAEQHPWHALTSPLPWNRQVQRPLVAQINCSATVAEATGVAHMNGVFATMNVSEPINGYTTMLPQDVPFDSQMITNDQFPAALYALNGTADNHRVLLLQRLANPLVNYNAVSNPYLTVDSLPISLTAYTGKPAVMGMTANWAFIGPTTLDSVQRGVTIAGVPAAQASVWQQAVTLPTALGAGSTETAPLLGSTLGYANYTYSYSDAPSFTVPSSAALPSFSRRYIDGSFGGVSQLPYQAANATDLMPPPDTFNANPDALETSGVTANEYIGEVQLAGNAKPAFFQWPNRPYVSGHELMQVPALSPSRLLAMPMNTAMGVDPRRGFSSMTITNPPLPALPQPVEYRARDDNELDQYTFGHLQDVFDQTGFSFMSGVAPLPPLPPSPLRPPHFHRILDYVGVPSRFVGTQTSLNPSRGYFQARPETMESATNPLRFPFCAPFNLVSEYREPGKINLNTVFDPLVFRALVGDPTQHGYLDPTDPIGSPPVPLPTTFPYRPGSDVNWQKFWDSRRGFNPPAAYPYTDGGSNLAVGGNGGIGLGDLNIVAAPAVTSPTYFAQPFRASGSQMLNPLNSMTYPNLDTTDTGRQYEVNANILRGVSTQMLGTAPLGPTGRPVDPLFINDERMADGTTRYIFRNTDANPTFRYELLQKLSNVATTRSNVYAIWITVGRFEVERAPREYYQWYSDAEFQQAFPDGYRFGKELGMDDANVERHRAFYIFDRTIPMGFQRGEKLNTDNGVLLRRIIQ